MERVIRLTIERLPEGVYLGQSEDVRGLVVQGDTVEDVLNYADDVARILLEYEGVPYDAPLTIVPIELPPALAA